MAGPAQSACGWQPVLPRGVRWWRVLAGVCLGLACATKWDALWYLPAFASLAIAWDAAAFSRAGLTRPGLLAVRKAARYLPVSFGLVPAARLPRLLQRLVRLERRL